MFGGGTPTKAVYTALVVGTILTAINHGDVILAGTPPSAWKVVLTYIVPYCVTTWGAITGKRAQWRQDWGSRTHLASVRGTPPRRHTGRRGGRLR